MTPEERQLIAGLFDRMRSFGSPDKDREAEALISQSVRAMPDAPYMLVQSVLVQEHALQEAGNRIQDLEEQVRALQGSQARQQGSGSFLGGLFGGGARSEAARTASVPSIGSRAGQTPWGGQPQAQQGMPPPQAAPAAGGGFLRSAMATAAGVAGGMLLADSIRNMMGGAGAGQAHAAKASSDQAAADKAEPASQKEPLYDQPDQHDRSTYDEPSDAGWDSGGFGGGDIEI
jgi:uncharacterized protein